VTALGHARWRSFEGLLSGLNSVGTLWIFVLMLAVNADVAGRTILNAPLPGVPEFGRLSIVGIIFLQLAHTLRSGRMTRADGLLRMAQRRWPRFAAGVEAVFSLAGAVVFAVLVYGSYRPLLRSWASGEYAGVEGYVTFPTWPVRLIIVVGCALAAIQFLLFARHHALVLLGLKSPDPVNVKAASAPVA
jgi:TRAP-type mannitol/chloroaromatic compound transport system permease small subunit